MPRVFSHRCGAPGVDLDETAPRRGRVVVALSAHTKSTPEAEDPLGNLVDLSEAIDFDQAASHMAFSTLGEGRM